MPRSLGHPNHRLIVVFRSRADLAIALRACEALGIAPVDRQVLSTSAEAPLGAESAGWRPVADADAAADALADQLWSGGRFGLVATLAGAALGLAAAVILLSLPVTGAPVQREGAQAVLFMAMGAAAAMLPVGLPLGAIWDERKVENARRRYRARMREGCWFLVARGGRRAVETLASDCRPMALEVCHSR